MFMRTSRKLTLSVSNVYDNHLEKNNDMFNSSKRSKHGLSLKAGESHSSESSSDDEDADPATNMTRAKEQRNQY
jgi:hypothetical protein